MKKTLNVSKIVLRRETLHRLQAQELRPVAGGYTGPDSHCTTAATCTGCRSYCRSLCLHC
jgi:hypothetical protein